MILSTPTLSHLQLFALRKAAKHTDGFAAIGKSTARALVKLGLAELRVPHTSEGLAVIQITQLGLQRCRENP